MISFNQASMFPADFCVPNRDAGRSLLYIAIPNLGMPRICLRRRAAALEGCIFEISKT